MLGKPERRHASGLFQAAQAADAGKLAAAGQPAAAPNQSPATTQTCSSRQSRPNNNRPNPHNAAPAAAAAGRAAAAVDLSGVGGAYPGDDAPKEQIAAWMAKEAEQRGLPPQLPVMAALVESNLTNVNFGDADSLGYFQMRVSIWNQGDYPGFADDPKKQIDWFLDTAERVKEQRLARGQSITDPDQFGEWIADVERPAEQYRGRYQLKLGEANGLLANAPDTPAAAPKPPVRAADAALEPAPPAMARGAGPKALAALEEAKKYTGTPYKWGGSTPQTGFDCSGLVQWAYAQAGVQIPRVTDAQIAATNGTAVRRSELLPGDLVFFRDASGYVHHVGHLDGRRQVPARPAHRRRGQGLEPRRAVLQGPVHRRPALRRRGRRARRGPGRGSRRRAGGRSRWRSPPPRPRSPATRPRRASRTAACSRRSTPRRRATTSSRARRPAWRAAARPASAGGRGLGGERAEQDSGLFFQAITAEQAAEAKAAAEAAAAAARRARGRRRAPAAPEVAAAGPGARGRADRAGGRAIPAGPPPDLAGVPADYPGDDAGQEELAKWLAKRAEKAGLPPELPVMAALVESGVRNLNFGDADSVGFFQMRVGIWNKGEYAGYPENPGLQAKWFIDTALARQAAADRRGRRGLRQGPGQVGRVDRRRRAPGRAVPRPLPAPARRGAPAAALTPQRGRAQSSPPPVEIGPSPPVDGRRRRVASAAATCWSSAAASWSVVGGASVVVGARRGRRRCCRSRTRPASASSSWAPAAPAARPRPRRRP